MEKTTSVGQTALLKTETKIYELLNRLDSVESTVNLMQRRIGKRLENTNIEVHHNNGASNNASMILQITSTDYQMTPTPFQKSHNGNDESSHWV